MSSEISVQNVDAALEDLIAQQRELSEIVHVWQIQQQQQDDASELALLEAELVSLEQQTKDDEEQELTLLEAELALLEQDNIPVPPSDPQSESQTGIGSTGLSSTQSTMNEAAKIAEDMRMLTRAMQLWSILTKELAEEARLRQEIVHSPPGLCSSAPTLSAITAPFLAAPPGPTAVLTRITSNERSKAVLDMTPDSPPPASVLFTALPVDVLCMCLQFLPLSERLSAFLVSSRFRFASQQPDCWTEKLILTLRTEKDLALFVSSLRPPNHLRFQRLQELELHVFRPHSSEARALLTATLQHLSTPSLRSLQTDSGWLSLFPSSLKHLTLENAAGHLESLRLHTFTQLTTLNMYCQDVTGKELRQLSSCVSLRVVDLSYCPLLTDEGLRFICALPLTELSLAYCPSLTGFGLSLLCGSSSPATLCTLSLAGYSELSFSSLNVLTRLSQLSHLSLHDCPAITSIPPLPASLRSLDVSLRSVGGIGGMSGLDVLCSLVSLNLNNRLVTDAQVKGVLQKCMSLQSLALRGCNLLSDACWLPHDK